MKGKNIGLKPSWQGEVVRVGTIKTGIQQYSNHEIYPKIMNLMVTSEHHES